MSYDYIKTFEELKTKYEQKDLEIQMLRKTLYKQEEEIMELKRQLEINKGN